MSKPISFSVCAVLAGISLGKVSDLVLTTVYPLNPER